MNSLSPDCVTAEGDDGVDSRVKDELEALNFASSEINKLETEIDKAREKFRHLLSDSTTRLNALYKKLGKCVGKARPYFELLKHSREAEDELTKATVAYQRANSTYRAAKETVALAEERMTSGSEADRPEFDSAWQEMMNHATMRFVETEKEKRASEDLHQKCAAEFTSVQQKLRALQKDIPRSINRAKPYFDLKDQLEGRLQGERRSVEDLQRALTAAKEVYRGSLVTLENISEEIHRQRKLDSLPVRTPGVGAEACGGEQSDMLAINLDTQSVASDVFPDESDVASLCSQDVASLLDSPSDQHTQVLLGQTEETVDSSTRYLSLDVCSKPPSPTEPTTSTVTTQQANQPTQNTTTCAPEVRNTANTDICTQAQSFTFPKNSDQNPLNTESSAAPSQLSSQSHSSRDAEPLDTRSVDGQSVNSVNKSRGRPKDKRVQRLNPSHFPILQGLTETNKRMSPKLPHARPGGQEVRSHHSPSPVRKPGTELFEFPEPKLRSKAAIAREASPGPNLFPDSDTSLFQKNSKHSKEGTKTQPKGYTKDTPVKARSEQNFDTMGDDKIKGESQSLKKEGPSLCDVNGGKSVCLNSGSLQGQVESKKVTGDGVTEDGKVFYHL